MNGEWAIEVKNLHHAFTAGPVLNDVSFEIGTGEIFGLLGPNGSGKTTLFRIFSTLLAARSGTVRVLGKDVRQEPGGVRRRIGVVFQSPSVDGKLTAFENLRHQGHLYGLRGSDLRLRIEDMLQRFGLSNRAHDRVETLSGGLARRVEIAKALLPRPGILLMDEPSAGLDPAARRELWDTIQATRPSRAGDRETTIVLTTHLMEEAEGCDRVGILDRGRLVALDTPTRLKAQIGGDSITFQSPDPETLAHEVRMRFGVQPVVASDMVRVERENGHVFVTDVVEAFPGLITSMMVRRPTLEDVFFHYTGHQFHAED